MKFLLILFTILSAGAVKAQSTNAVVTNGVPSKTSQILEAQTASRIDRTLNLTSPKPNEIAKGKVIYSGLAVEVVKKRNPLQLINPLAPPEYGSPEDNIYREPLNGRVTGLKFFAIRF